PGMAPNAPGASGPGGMGPGGMAGGMAAGMQGQMQEQQQQMRARVQAQMQGQMRGQMGGQKGGQMPPGAGMPGGGPGGNADQPADFRTPEGAVTAFLNALKAKDLNRLTEATALRAGTDETKKRNQEMFRRIFDGSLSESELNKLASSLEGYQISQIIPQTSSNSAHVV